MTGRALCGLMLVLWACAACGDDPVPPVDSDGDGLSDADEARLGTDPNQVDSDLDGVPDYSDDADGDGVSNAEEIAAGTAIAPSGPSSSRQSGSAGAAADDGAAAGAGEPGSAQDPPADGDAPADKPSDIPGELPSEVPGDQPTTDTCAALREKCAAGEAAACERFKLECEQPAPPNGTPSCDQLWGLCKQTMQRGCEAFIARCELPGCEDLKAVCDTGNAPVCALHARECSDSSGPGNGDEPAYCGDLRAACEAGSEGACELVTSDCNVEIDCAALELSCKEAGGVGEACDQLAAHCS